MALPVNIEDLVHGNTVEWERLEFKQGWNPEDVIHSMCAFANDIHNWGGGYIIVGIAEQDGQPVLPPAGLQQNQLDSIQKNIIQLGHKISPNYFPVVQPYLFDNKHILVIWCPAGDNRPYEAPETLGKGVQRVPYIRITSNSIKAQGENLRRLQELAARIPFDDRINNQATIGALDLGLIREYLQEIKSSLLEESAQMPFTDLCKTMLIAKGPNEDIRPVNVGLLFFSKQPEQYFDRAWIELVWHKDDSGKNFKEVYFKGPLHKQLRDALSYISTNIINEEVVKHPDVAEAERFYNYPFEAVEEALSNAVYHKGYDHGAPIEIQIFPDRMTILSHPGPVPPVNQQVLSTKKRIIAREYRNRRIGDFLKELRLTEGRGTGFPAIYRAMEANGSPDPDFETDDASYVLVTLPAHISDQVSDGANDQATNEVNDIVFNDLGDIVEFSNGVSNGVSNGARNQAQTIIANKVHDRVAEVLSITAKWVKREELFGKMDLSNQSTNRKKYLDPLINHGWIEMEYPETPTHPNQRYRITDSGMRLKQLIEQ
ncbi:ATP-binding protein [Sunxiuqinia sp. A32]|uniref:ATP-binding protein n=1 Tax=Sunxiuqinia sp. A32 TaxID=3461496 RepID=UPI004045C5B2